MIVCVIESGVEIICAFAWKLRCAVIMLTSCAVMSTFDASSAPAWIRPKPELPAGRGSPGPSANVSAHVRVAELLQALRVREVRQRDLAERFERPLVKRACTTPLVVDVDADQAAGREAVLRHRVDA